jgi:hypothetical protein
MCPPIDALLTQAIALLDVLDSDDVKFDEVTFCGPSGRQLLPNQSKLRVKLRNPKTRFRVGKLLQWYRSEEVAEFDGDHGMPSWATFDNQIFDVTGMLFRPLIILAICMPPEETY